ncbi:MAG: 3-phosphoshikimate 1-carboxyvinyltransferase, partial [Defluviitaleaceae bacterium]|nr:3-phosphoshikimate 1-carboxyvinyltransferase [Defluviitaleaceae bacterium]
MMDISVPGDKSITHRAIILASLTNSLVNIRGFLVSEDTMHTVECMRQLGVHIEVEEASSAAMVHGVGIYGLKAPEKPLYTGN